MTEVQRWYQAFRPLILVCVQYIPSDNKVDFGIVNAAVGPFRGSPRFYQVLPVLFPFRLKPIGSVGTVDLDLISLVQLPFGFLEQ
ncbi:MAG: hypothetical protein EOM51_11290 [Clostridia bacterium]|nr:hypothetical protein [Clostridia bacterium]